jgi:pimeloyl-ACP methyl ester carboxylesterase
MRQVTKRIGVAAGLVIAALGAGIAAAQPPQPPQPAHGLLGIDCDAPPAYHCPDTDCLSSVVTQSGNTVELKTRRTYFLDCPKGYKPGDKVNVVLSLHGFGSYANWERNYFPAMDVKDKYKLVVITPGSPTRSWTDYDDTYLANIVDSVVGAVGKANVQRFILAGHSQGGITSNRIICTPYFRDKVDVRISLSGGRVGPTTPANRGFADGGPPVYQQDPRNPPAAAAAGRGGLGPLGAAPTGPPGGDCDYSFIFSNGEYESLPAATSPLADKFACGPRVQQADVVDPKAGYVWDATRQDPGTDGWGHYPRSGRSQVFVFPGCKDGRVVADVVKLKKGHTEGYEPNVTDKLIELAVSAKGGKIATGSWTPPPPPPPPANPFGPAPGRGGPPPAGRAG